MQLLSPWPCGRIHRAKPPWQSLAERGRGMPSSCSNARLLWGACVIRIAQLQCRHADKQSSFVCENFFRAVCLTTAQHLHLLIGLTRLDLSTPATTQSVLVSRATAAHLRRKQRASKPTSLGRSHQGNGVSFQLSPGLLASLQTLGNLAAEAWQQKFQ